MELRVVVQGDVRVFRESVATILCAEHCMRVVATAITATAAINPNFRIMFPSPVQPTCAGLNLTVH